MYCNKNNDSRIYAKYCTLQGNVTICDDYFNEHETKVMAGIPGIASGVIKGRFC